MPLTLNPYPITRSHGFTIVETLVAITILMIAIAGPLTIASQALHAAQDAKNQMIAANLAQESVEEIRNFKDNGLRSGSLVQILGRYVSDVPQSVEVSSYPGGSYTLSTCVTQTCDLYLDPSRGYIYENTVGSLATPFHRWFSLVPKGDLQNISEYLLTVTVSWTTGTVPNQIQVQTLLSSSSR